MNGNQHSTKQKRIWLPTAFVALCITAGYVHLGYNNKVSGYKETVPVVRQSHISFNHDIRPLLNTNCIACHGGVRKEGGVSFIFRDEAFGFGESGKPTIVAGDPEASELIARVTHHDADERMPFDRPALTTDQIELLREWIRQGAVWEDHWSFVPLQKPQLPPTAGAATPLSLIDYFIHERLQQEGLPANPEASKLALLRRASLDLIGLPPTPDEIAAFQADTSNNAYEKQVDRLLKSPHFGERWASMWMDLARYADSRGYEQDKLRIVWPYRNWVIRAFNQNMPYDEFVIKQMAADLMPDTDFPDLIATTFQRLTQSNDESGTDDEEFRLLAVMDRSATAWNVINGLTMQCAQCHSHPYDPIRHEEYYQSLAFFNTSQDADLMQDEYPSFLVTRNPTQTETANALQQQLHELKTGLTRSGKQLVEATTWQPLPITTAYYDPLMGIERRIDRINSRKEVDAEPNQQQLADSLAAAKAVDDATVPLLLAMGEARSDGIAPNIAIVKLEALTEERTLTALRVEVPPLDEEVARHSPENGFIVEQVDAWLVLVDGKKQKIPFSYFVPDSEENINFIHGTTQWRRHVIAGRNEIELDPGDLRSTTGAFAANSKQFYTRWTVGIVDKPLAVPAGSRIEVHLSYGEYFGAGVTPAPVRRVRLSSSSDLAWIDYARDKIRRDSVDQLEKTEKRLAGIFGFLVPVMREQEQSIARETRLFHRGNPFEKTGEALLPGTPQFLPKFESGARPTRLDLAKWFFSPEQPLTARVAVNRFWEQLFGTGLVETLEDFGSVGTAPSHPALLDSLAWRFQHELKWDMKALLRELVLSAAYRRSAHATVEMIDQDPHNRLLARGPQQRLSAEMIRDQMLVASGLLTRKIGGRIVMPPQPAGESDSIANPFKWQESQGADRYRRAIYTLLKRSSIYPGLAVFDAPTRLITHARRTPTNTPLQALATLNDPVYTEAERALAENLIAGSNDNAARIDEIALRVLSRPFTPSERAEIIALYDDLNAMSNGDGVSSLTSVVATVFNMDAALVR